MTGILQFLLVALAILLSASLILSIMPRSQRHDKLDKRSATLQNIVEIAQAIQSTQGASMWTEVDTDLHIRFHDSVSGSFAFLVLKGDPNKRHAATIRCIVLNNNAAWAKDSQSDPTITGEQTTVEGMLRMLSLGSSTVSGAEQLKPGQLALFEGQLKAMQIRLSGN
ncbi:MAG: hypothetical protein PVI21_04150 [Candidatus Woesebacteria bacterium]|jgi:hypothetical protein